MNIIPAIDLRQGQCVRLYQGDFERQTTYNKDPVSLARDYKTMGFDELHVVDLDGARSGRQQNQEIIRKIVTTSKLTVQLGGGIRTESELESWLNAGVARVVIGSLAVTQSHLVRRWLAKHSPERIVLALDVSVDQVGEPRVTTYRWTRAAEMNLWQCIDGFSADRLRH